MGCLWMLWAADFLCFLPVRPMPWLRGISVHATAARRTRRGRLLDGDLQQEGAHIWSLVAGASGLTRGRGVYREAGLPNTLGCIPAEKSGPEKIYSYIEPYPPLVRPARFVARYGSRPNKFGRSWDAPQNPYDGKGASGAAKFTPRGTTYVFVNVVVGNPRYVARVQPGRGELKSLSLSDLPSIVLRNTFVG